MTDSLNLYENDAVPGWCNEQLPHTLSSPTTIGMSDP